MNLPVDYNAIPTNQRRHVRNEYIRLQGGLCYACQAPLDEDVAEELRHVSINLDLFPPGFLAHPVHLHHDHNSGLTIGAVHAKCNAMLWQYLGE